MVADKFPQVVLYWETIFWFQITEVRCKRVFQYITSIDDIQPIIGTLHVKYSVSHRSYSGTKHLIFNIYYTSWYKLNKWVEFPEHMKQRQSGWRKCVNKRSQDGLSPGPSRRVCNFTAHGFGGHIPHCNFFQSLLPALAPSSLFGSARKQITREQVDEEQEEGILFGERLITACH